MAEVSVKSCKTYNPDGFPRICAIDCGLKLNQIRCFVKRGARVDLVPWDHAIDDKEYDGLFLSNGPGDPVVCKKTVDNIQRVRVYLSARFSSFQTFFKNSNRYLDLAVRSPSLVFVWVINCSPLLLDVKRIKCCTVIVVTTCHAYIKTPATVI